VARREQHEQRFEAIYREHAAAVLAYARRRATAAVAEEVLADTFLVCWRRLDRVPEEPLPWLYAVARKTLANERRAARRRQGHEQPLVAEVAVVGELSDGPLAGALAQLGDGDRELLLLVAWEGLSLAEAATVVGCTAVACRVRFHRARKRLAALLEPSTPIRLPDPQGAQR
jgi:RNA polymerase sigma-70 factor (ECF subfamily)